ncbi:hypothetical protein NQ661_17080, partial [Acinetobacter baumannii]|nr:hypothetical protein [Acinetobacter baumannii]
MATNWNAVLANVNNSADILAILRKVLSLLELKVDGTTIDEVLAQLEKVAADGQITIEEALETLTFLDQKIDERTSAFNDAIEAAAAAGAGANGWTANLVAYDGSTQDLFNNKLKDKTNWVVTVEQFGGTEGADNSIAFQSAYDYLKTIGGGTLTSNIRHHIISQTVKYYDNITTDLNFAEVEILAGGRFSGAIYNADKTASSAPILAEIYYKNQQSLDAGNPISRITVDATVGSTSVVVENAAGFQVGDLIFFNNGYCDMWRVME